MNTLPKTILRQAQSLPEGDVLSPKKSLRLGGRAAMDQAFSRLAKAGKLLRVAHGAYIVPVFSRFGSRLPASEKVVKAMAEQSEEILAPPHGASAANTLGLTQQLLIRRIYLTSGRTRKLKLGCSEVLVRHAPQCGALAWIGPKHAKESLASLHRIPPAVNWQVLTLAWATLPSWMAHAIGKETERE